jgi:hypothetical protein
VPAVKDAGEILDRKQTLFKIGVIHGVYPFAADVLSGERHWRKDKPSVRGNPEPIYGGKKIP